VTPKNESDSTEDDSRGILDEAASLDTTGIGILGQTAQVSVTLPQDDDDDDLVDDAVVDGEILSELIVDPPIDAAAVPAADERVGRIQEDRIGIIIELPAEEPAAATSAEPGTEEPADEVVEGVVEAEPDAEPEDETETESADTRAPGSESVESADAARDERADPPVVADEVIADPVVIGPAGSVEDATTTKPKTKKKPRARSTTIPDPDTAPDPVPAEPAPSEPATSEPVPSSATSAWIAAALKQDATAPPAPTPAASVPAEKAKSETVTNSEEDPKPAPKPTETAIAQRPAATRPEVALTSKRLGDQLGQSTRESADLLTADRLLDPHQVTKPEPEGAWSHLLYTASGRRINLGDGKRARARKALTARIAGSLTGGARFVPVLSRKGGVGKTTITALLGMALADARDDRVIAVDANPDRGTLADRIVRTHNKSVRDLVRVHDEVKGYHDVSSIVARDSTRLDVLASDSDPRIAEAFNDDDYRDVASIAAHYYSLVLTDTGTGIVHSVMAATLDLADQLIIVSGLSVDEARLASETLTWLETNGYAELARGSIVVLNQSTPGSPLVRLNELEAHFATRAKSVLRMPYDSQIAGGGAIVFANLQSETRQAARELAASLVEGLRASAA
jgi:MinD-like ATPase involved in chromosome partitioning or flagellar assembly